MIKETEKEKRVGEKENWREVVIGDTLEGGRIRGVGIKYILMLSVILKFSLT